jgi:hypothetical protein
MKTIKNGKQVPARTYYYILDYLDRHYSEHILYSLFKKERLQDLNLGEYNTIFTKVVNSDQQLINNM